MIFCVESYEIWYLIPYTKWINMYWYTLHNRFLYHGTLRCDVSIQHRSMPETLDFGTLSHFLFAIPFLLIQIKYTGYDPYCLPYWFFMWLGAQFLQHNQHFVVWTEHFGIFIQFFASYCCYNKLILTGYSFNCGYWGLNKWNLSFCDLCY